MLPLSKDDFPKCLYLDQNKWIDLARAHYDRPGGELFKDALRAVRRGVESARVIVPFSMVNAVEAMFPRDSRRRKRLAQFMVDLSCNRTILPEQQATRWEIWNALDLLFGRGKPMPVRPLVVQQGFSNALGFDDLVFGPTAKEEAVVRHIHSPDMTMDFLSVVSVKRDRIERGRAAEGRWVSIFEKVRSNAALLGLGPEQRRVLAFTAMFSATGNHAPDLVWAMQGLGLTFEEFSSRVNSAEDIARLAAHVPNLDVFVTLTVARKQDLVRPIHRNDLRDLDWLSVAVPYANLIVSENYWGHQVRATGLDEKYGTVLLTDLRELPDRLQAIGCAA